MRASSSASSESGSSSATSLLRLRKALRLPATKISVVEVLKGAILRAHFSGVILTVRLPTDWSLDSRKSLPGK